MNSVKEEWRNVESFPNYQVSSLGGIRNITTNKLLRPYDAGNGYLRIGLIRDKKKFQFYVHRLVLLAFKGNPPDDLKITCDHQDGNKRNNNINNLFWASYKDQQENIKARKFFSFEDQPPKEPRLSQVEILFRMYFT
jgi:hypothetical protein